MQMSESKCKRNCGYMNCNSCVYDFMRCKKKKTSTNIESLPDELVFDILLRLPAQDIYDGGRFVCKKWYNTVRNRKFIYEHLHHSTPGLLIQEYTPKYDPVVFAAIRRRKIEISNFDYKFNNRVLASCNGLVLTYDSNNRYALQIVNPATKQRLFVTPPFFQDVNNHNSFGLVHVAATMEYKVVHTYFYLMDEYFWGCDVLTAGVDKCWRRVHSRNISLSPTIINCTEQITEGFMHWTDNNYCVLTLNVETEIISITTPVSPDYKYRPKWFLSTGKSLSMLIWCYDFSFDVWDMKPETGEWKKMHKIDLGAHKHIFKPLSEYTRPIPVAWLRDGEVLVLCGSDNIGVCIAYNVLTQEIVSSDDNFNRHMFQVHTNSLVSL